MHFLAKTKAGKEYVARENTTLTKLRASRMVELEMDGKNPILVAVKGTQSIGIMKVGTEIVPLPKDIKVLDGFNREVILPDRKFWITIGTIDPYHAIIDWDPNA